MLHISVVGTIAALDEITAMRFVSVLSNSSILMLEPAKP
jgi:hypothetical protein